MEGDIGALDALWVIYAVVACATVFLLVRLGVVNVRDLGSELRTTVLSFACGFLGFAAPVVIADELGHPRSTGLGALMLLCGVAGFGGGFWLGLWLARRQRPRAASEGDRAI